MIFHENSYNLDALFTFLAKKIVFILISEYVF
jgi:hypothetical protein